MRNWIKAGYTPNKKTLIGRRNSTTATWILVLVTVMATVSQSSVMKTCKTIWSCSWRRSLWRKPEASYHYYSGNPPKIATSSWSSVWSGWSEKPINVTNPRQLRCSTTKSSSLPTYCFSLISNSFGSWTKIPTYWDGWWRRCRQTGRAPPLSFSFIEESSGN